MTHNKQLIPQSNGFQNTFVNPVISFTTIRAQYDFINLVF